MQREDALSKFERSLFSFFYLLKFDNAMPRLKSLLFFGQSLQLFFLVVAIPACFHATQWVQIPLYILDFSMGSISPLTAYVSFGICAGFTVLFALCAVVVEIVFQKDSTAVLWPLRILRCLYFIFEWVLLIPMLGSILDILDCRYSAAPVVHDLFPNVQCWASPHIFPSVAALVALAVFLVVAAGGALFIFPAVGFDSRARGRCDLLVSTCKVLLVCASRVLTIHTVLRTVIVLICTAAILGSLLFMLPFHNRIANMLYAGQYWVCFLAALEWSILNLALPQYADSWVPFVVLVGIAAITTPFVVWFTFRRYNSAMALQRAAILHVLSVKPPPVGVIRPPVKPAAPLAAKPASGTGSVHPGDGSPTAGSPTAGSPTAGTSSAEVPAEQQSITIASTTSLALGVSSTASITPASTSTSTALLHPPAPVPAAKPRQTAYGLTPAQRFSAEAQAALGIPPPDKVMALCRWSWQVEWATRFLRWKDAAADPRLLNFVKVLYAKGMAKFPESHGLLLNYAEFMQIFQHNAAASIALIRRVAALPNSALDTRFSIYAAERIFETTGEGAHISGFMSALTLKRTMKQAQIHQRRAKKHLARVWAFLMRPSYDMRGLPPLLDSAVAHANTALEAYSSLLQSFPTNVPLIRAYGSLLQDLYGDTELADTIFMQADQMEEEKPGEHTATEAGLPLDPGMGLPRTANLRRALSPDPTPPPRRTALTITDDEPARKAPTSPGPSGTAGRPNLPGAAPAKGPASIRSMGKSLSRDDTSEGLSIFDHRLVMRFLTHRHDAKDDEGNGASDGPDDQAGCCDMARLVGWLLFLLHLASIGMLIVCLVFQTGAVEGTDLKGDMVRGTANCSLLVEKIAYEARKVLEVLLGPDGQRIGNVTALGSAAQGSISALSARLFAFATQLSDLLLVTGAQGQQARAWMVRAHSFTFLGRLATMCACGFGHADGFFPCAQEWMSPVLLPVVTGGVLTVVNRDSMSLSAPCPTWFEGGDVGSMGPRTATLQSELLYLLMNGPMVLGPALANMTTYTAAIQDSNNVIMVTAPACTAAVAVTFCALATVISCWSLRRTARDRRAVLTNYVRIPKEEAETQARCPVPRDASVANKAPHPSSSTSTLRLSPPFLEDETAHLVTALPLPESASMDSLTSPSSASLQGSDSATFLPSCDSTPLLQPGDASRSSRSQSALPALQPTFSLDLRSSHQTLPADVEVAMHPHASLAALLAGIAPQEGDASVLMECGSTKAETVVGFTRVPSADLVSSKQPQSRGGKPGPVEEDDSIAEDGALEEEARMREESTKAQEARALEKERILAKLSMFSASLVVRALFAIVGVGILMLCTGFIGLVQLKATEAYTQQMAAYGVRVSQVGQTNNLAFQLVHNRTLEFLPTASQEQSAPIRAILDADPRYPYAKTDRDLLRPLTQSALADLTALSRIISYGGVFSGTVIPASLGQCPAEDALWFQPRACWLYQPERCATDRMPGWPVNGTLNALMESYLQAIMALISMDDVEVTPANERFLFADTAFELDLPDGLDRVIGAYTEFVRTGLDSLLSFQVVFYSLSMVAILASYLFLFRIDLVQGELTKSALMRALIPAAAFARTSRANITCMNVRMLDDLHWVGVSNNTFARQALDNRRPASHHPSPRTTASSPDIIEYLETSLTAVRQAQQEEERLMRQLKMPNRAAHAKDHTAVRTAYEGPLNALKAGKPDAMAQVEAVMRVRPLITHVTQLDAPLGRFLNQHGIF
ncbi:hypothetical protein PAPYR_3734 [Paratrimastix pyriformis]|uniref:TmcB/TmcC TPR repeats domain-containing protein n=1 Tax=Paratrimastix pyriformis TaxID=342808 RepID=A0ABQ8UQN2_9EUKA|nr:hypothetical protein PAPYR_3734 [Paratrimastix pyriformis]